MPQDPNHYSLRLLGNNNADRIALMQRTGANANSVLNAALAVGFAALLHEWSAAHVRQTTEREQRRLHHEGNASKFRNALCTPATKGRLHAKPNLHV